MTDFHRHLVSYGALELLFAPRDGSSAAHRALVSIEERKTDAQPEVHEARSRIEARVPLLLIANERKDVGNSQGFLKVHVPPRSLPPLELRHHLGPGLGGLGGKGLDVSDLAFESRRRRGPERAFVLRHAQKPEELGARALEQNLRRHLVFQEPEPLRLDAPQVSSGHLAALVANPAQSDDLIEVFEDLVRKREIRLRLYQRRVGRFEAKAQLSLEGADVVSRRAEERPGKLRALCPFASEQNGLLHRQEQFPGSGISLDRVEALRFQGQRRIGKLSRLLQLSRGGSLALPLGRKERVLLPQDLEGLLEGKLLGKDLCHRFLSLSFRSHAEKRGEQKRERDLAHETSWKTIHEPRTRGLFDCRLGDGVSGGFGRPVELCGRKRSVPRLEGAHGLSGPKPGIEGESRGAFDATGAAETVVDVIWLRAAPVAFTPPARIGIGRTDGRTQQIPRQVRKRETEQEHHGCASQVPMPLTQHDDFTVTPRLEERQILVRLCGRVTTHSV